MLQLAAPMYGKSVEMHVSWQGAVTVECPQWPPVCLLTGLCTVQRSTSMSSVSYWICMLDLRPLTLEKRASSLPVLADASGTQEATRHHMVLRQPTQRFPGQLGQWGMCWELH